MHELTRQDARRIAVGAQLLDAERPTDMLAVIRHLTLLQADFTAAVARNAELVLWSRLGSSFEAADLADATAEGLLVEFQAMVRPAEDLALYRAEMAAWPGVGDLPDYHQQIRDWVEANDVCRRDILDELETSGPLPARDLPNTWAVPWTSSGWTDNKTIVRMLDFMEARGEVAVAHRDGRERVWDLAERVYPEVDAVPSDAAMRERRRRRLRALGIARSRSAVCPGEPNDVGDSGEDAVVEGVKGTWRVDPDLLGRAFRGRAALLSPLDRLVFDRKRMTEIFEFDYQLEMYKPAAKRRWGYWAMPILYGDQLVGKLDATAERDAGVLRVDAVHEDGDWTKTQRQAVHREIRDLAEWLDLELLLPG